MSLIHIASSTTVREGQFYAFRDRILWVTGGKFFNYPDYSNIIFAISMCIKYDGYDSTKLLYESLCKKQHYSNNIGKMDSFFPVN